MSVSTLTSIESGQVHTEIYALDIDQSFSGAVARLHAHFGDDAGRLLKRRFRIIK